MLTLVAASAVQDVLAPGSLTLEEARADPRQADPRYVAASAGKKSVQLQGGATLQSDTPLGMFSATVYGLIRRLDNPLTFAFIDLDRTAGGGYAQLRNRVGRLDWRVSVDARSQRDIRLNTDHENREEILLDQRERVHSVSLAGALRADVTGRLSATAGVRLDAIRFRMTDHYLLNGDQSGDRDFSAFSPAVGVSYRAGPAVAYASISTAFETPTATELVNRPDGDGGFNASLGPQRTLGYEVGVRGEIPAARLRLDAALFRLHIRDRLLPEQNAEGRTFYHNAGKNSHQGIEVALEWPARHSTTLQITYAGGRFVFLNDPGQGLHIPGSPAHHLYVGLRTRHRGFVGEIAAELASDTWADSGNTTRSDGYGSIDLYAGHMSWKLGGVHVQPFLRVQNALSARYNGSLVVNAFGGRFFEPAATRSVQAGVGMAL